MCADEVYVSPVPTRPDNSRRPKGSCRPRNIPKKLWVDQDEADKFNELRQRYGSTESALIRWLIHLGLERVEGSDFQDEEDPALAELRELRASKTA